MRLFLLLFLAGLSGFTMAQTSAAPNGNLAAQQLKPFGRTRINENGNLELISTAAHFGFSFTGKKCLVYAFVPGDGTVGYLQYEADGKYRNRVRLSSQPDSPVVITLKNAGRHEVWIYKTTEASSGPVIVKKIDGTAVAAAAFPDKPLIEFIGNSITSGAASDSSSFPCRMGNYHEHTNGYMAYGPRVARKLGLNYVVNSVSGIGVYRTWNLDTPSMPAVYENLQLSTGDRSKWDFSNYSPSIVSIALGTNDLSGGDGVHPRPAFDSALFTSRYIGFVQFIKSKHPAAQILLLNSPMLDGERDRLLRNCLLAVKSAIDASHPSDKPVACFYFKPMHANGCIGHPSVSDHAELAAELKPFLKRMLAGNTK